MKNKLFKVTAAALFLFNFIIAQDPPPLPDAPNQGPINGLAILAIGGILIVLKRYFERIR